MEKILYNGALFFARNDDFDSANYLILKNKSKVCDESINIRDRFGKTMLFYAAEKNATNFLISLLSRGANTSIGDKNGITPLMISAAKGNTSSTEIITKHLRDINNKGDVDLVDNNGNTALMHAVLNGRSRDVILLLNFGANKDILNDEHIDAYRLALLFKLQHIAYVIKNHGKIKLKEELNSIKR
ncbi:MAG: ankyrin repeat domain-containing protein [Candidatus Micrarchaeia archaeon]